MDTWILPRQILRFSAPSAVRIGVNSFSVCKQELLTKHEKGMMRLVGPRTASFFLSMILQSSRHRDTGSFPFTPLVAWRVVDLSPFVFFFTWTEAPSAEKAILTSEGIVAIRLTWTVDCPDEDEEAHSLGSPCRAPPARAMHPPDTAGF